ncbi:MAG TPA: rubredoxin [Methanocorpusculum sp.]|nr:rubredoxin [Candidatus Methanocorpusculum equi]MCQ2357566.1 rubredoxin [Methanocorpusculum sp.]HJJ32883.1 rubredoxin [Methanocorpusculum sp.]HJJ44641.1 rubredoxin [Methanocorpusculum sp.]
MDKYRCTICGYVYDPEKGAGIMYPAGTAFASLPDTWKCPICGAGKSSFTKV